MSSQVLNRCWPKAVRVIPRWDLMQSGTPTCDSSRLRAALMLGCCRFNAFAAAPMLPLRAIWQNTLKRFQSMFRENCPPSCDNDHDGLMGNPFSRLGAAKFNPPTSDDREHISLQYLSGRLHRMSSKLHTQKGAGLPTPCVNPFRIRGRI